MTGARIIAQAAGMDGMIGGLTSDILMKAQEPDPELLENNHSPKNGALIKASVLAGAAAKRELAAMQCRH
jgi:geranylgeranyl diphosphate synthase type II